MVLYAKVDVTFPDDPKVIDAGDIAELVYLRCVFRCKQFGTDGVIDRRRLERWMLGIRGKPEQHMETLVAVGLLCTHEAGWCIPPNAWRKWNLTNSQVEEKRRKKAEAAVKGNHERWHVDGKRSDDCPHCIAETSQVRSHNRSSDDPKRSLEIELELEQGAATDDPVLTEARRRVAVLKVCGKKFTDEASYTASIYERLRFEGWEPEQHATECDDAFCDGGFIEEPDGSMLPCANCNPWLVKR